MRKRSNDRVTFLFRSKRVRAVSLVAAGATLLALGLPADWIDLAALTLAAVTAWPTDATRPGPTARKLRRKNRGPSAPGRSSHRPHR
jgi:hypothetical protein